MMGSKLLVAGVVIAVCGHAQAQTGGIVPRLLDKRKPAPAAAWVLQGRVIHVADGDTFTLLTDGNKQIVVRLSDIDAPEVAHGSKRPAQPYSKRSKEYLAAIIAGRIVIAECHDVDRRLTNKGEFRERYVCEVWQGGVNAGQAMLEAGMAFANRRSARFIRNPQTLKRESMAHSMRRGLWVQDRPVEPWVWRDACWGRGKCDSAGS